MARGDTNSAFSLLSNPTPLREGLNLFWPGRLGALAFPLAALRLELMRVSGFYLMFCSRCLGGSLRVCRMLKKGEVECSESMKLQLLFCPL